MDMLNKEVREATPKKIDDETVFLDHILKTVAQDRK